MVGIRFNEARFRADFAAYFLGVCEELTGELLREAEAAAPDPEVRASLEKLVEVVGLEVLGVVGTDHWLGVLREFGRGSLMAMDADNPGLRAYIQGPLWNPLRPRQAQAPIMGRPEGWYTNIKGERVYTKGTMAGRVLEGMSPWFDPWEPEFWLRNAARWLVPRIRKRLQQALVGFDYGRYIEVG